MKGKLAERRSTKRSNCMTDFAEKIKIDDYSDSAATTISSHQPNTSKATRNASSEYPSCLAVSKTLCDAFNRAMVGFRVSVKDGSSWRAFS
jgi:hypothetical protein